MIHSAACLVQHISNLLLLGASQANPAPACITHDTIWACSDRLVMVWLQFNCTNGLITTKPIIYVVNISEKSITTCVRATVRLSTRMSTSRATVRLSTRLSARVD